MVEDATTHTDMVNNKERQAASVPETSLDVILLCRQAHVRRCGRPLNSA